MFQFNRWYADARKTCCDAVDIQKAWKDVEGQNIVMENVPSSLWGFRFSAGIWLELRFRKQGTVLVPLRPGIELMGITSGFSYASKGDINALLGSKKHVQTWHCARGNFHRQKPGLPVRSPIRVEIRDFAAVLHLGEDQYIMC